ncbi:hypothetical protein [Aquimarina algiphila]|uniref:hypothetical protein n=1 Tax=Aquimarina algiphila TaxID=2047982 RepID=UPI00232D8DDA|nr:hypothetical protein [Aquimarina algiphila]
MNTNFLPYLIITVIITLICTSCKKEIQKEQPIKKIVTVETNTTKKDTLSVIKIPENAVPISVSEFEKKFKDQLKDSLGVYMPITSGLVYTDNISKHYILFTEDRSIIKNKDTLNSKIKAFIISETQGSLINAYEISENTYAPDINTDFRFLKKHCSFTDIDKDGIIDPIIISTSTYDDIITSSITMCYKNKVAKIFCRKNDSDEEDTSFEISPTFYSFPDEIQNHVLHTMEELEYEDLAYFGKFREIINQKAHFGNSESTISVHIPENIYTTQIQQKIPNTLLIKENNTYTLNTLLKTYESAFPKSSIVSIDFPIYPTLDFHSGVISNNITTEEIYIPIHEIEYFYISEKNEVFRKKIISGDWFDSYHLKPDEDAPLDDSNIDYDSYNGRYLVQSWDYQNGWESEKVSLFPKQMKEGNYLAFSRLSYFDGKEKRAIYSSKDSIYYATPERNPYMVSEDIKRLKNKYQELYPASHDLDLETGITLLTGFENPSYVVTPWFKNNSEENIDLNHSSFTIYYISNDSIIYEKKIGEYDDLGILTPEDENILDDSFMIEIKNGDWIFNQGDLSQGYFPEDMKYGEYLMYSKIETAQGKTYYSKKEFLHYLSPYGNNKKDNKEDRKETKEFYKNLTLITQKGDTISNTLNCYEEKINNHTVNTCVYPKSYTLKNLYKVYRNLNFERENLLPDIPEKDTIYFSKKYNKISYILPKTETDSIKISIETEKYEQEYFLYKTVDYSQVSKRFIDKN